MPKQKYTLEIYKDKKGEFRFRVVHKNGKILFQSSEGYKRKAAMMRIYNSFILNASIYNVAINDLTKK